jgi:hypothetical protein
VKAGICSDLLTLYLESDPGGRSLISKRRAGDVFYGRIAFQRSLGDPESPNPLSRISESPVPNPLESPSSEMQAARLVSADIHDPGREFNAAGRDVANG